MDGRSDTRRHVLAAALLAVPLALLLLAIADAASLPAKLLRARPEIGFGVLALCLAAAGAQLLVPIAYHALGALLPAAARRLPRLRLPAAAVATAAALAVPWHAYAVLVDYRRFAGHPPFVAATAALGLFLAAWTAWSTGLLEPARRRLGRLAAVIDAALPLAALLGAIAAALANRLAFPDAYPTLHSALLEICYLLLAPALAAGLAPLLRRHPSRRGAAAAVAAALAPFAIAVPVAATSAAAESEPFFLSRTVLGTRVAEGRDPAPAGRSRPAPLAPVDGLAALDRYGRLPRLPDDFDLTGHNVLLISVETTRFDETSLADPRKGTTPRLAALAADGAFWFTRAYSPAPCTIQSLSSVFTMRPTSAVALRLDDPPWHGALVPENETVAELFRRSGYRTFWVGHNLGGNFGTKINGFGQGFSGIDLCRPGQADCDGWIAAEAVARMTDAAAAGRRFFTWVFLGSPHTFFKARYPEMPGRTERDLYRQAIRRADEAVGAILDGLAAAGLRERTVVIVHADHGEAFPSDRGGSRSHHTLFQETTRIPLLIRVPGLRGGRSDAPVALAHVFPWLLRHGSPAQRAAAKRVLDEVVGPLLELTGGAVVGELRRERGGTTALVTERYRTVYQHASKSYQVYDELRDPLEKDDLYGVDAAATRQARDLMERFLEARRAVDRVEYSGVHRAKRPPVKKAKAKKAKAKKAKAGVPKAAPAIPLVPPIKER